MIRSRLSMRMLRDSRSWLGMVVLLLGLFGGGARAAFGQEAKVQALLERARTAGANAEHVQMVANRARQAGLSADATVSLLRPAVALAEQDLPTGPLLSKILEGLAKQVPISRMQPVLQQYRTNIEQAGRLVGQWAQRSEVRQLLGASNSARTKAPPELITAVAEAQQQDVPAKNIEAFLSSLPANVDRRPLSPNQVAAAVRVLPELNKGLSAKTERRLLTSALNAGYSPESLRQLPSALQSAHYRSKQPVDALARGVAKAIARGTPAATVLQSLFRGNLPGRGPPSGVGTAPSGNGPGAGKPPGPPGKKGPPSNPPGGGPGSGGPGSGGPGGGGPGGGGSGGGSP